MEHHKPNGPFKRKTKQRDLILSELRGMTNHPTAADLHEKLRETLPKISLGTIYRNLDALTQAGVVRKIDTATGEARFDANLNDHFHVRCEICNRVDDVWDTPGIEPDGNVEQLSGYRITGFRFEFFGVCPACRDSKQS